MYSALTEGAWKEKAPEADGHIRALLFPNLRRKQVQVRSSCGGWVGRGRAASMLAAVPRISSGCWACCSWRHCCCFTFLQCLLPSPPLMPYTTCPQPATNVQGLNWVMDMLRLALRPGLASPQALPRMLFADELESLDPTAWLALERVLLVHTRCAGLPVRASVATEGPAALGLAACCTVVSGDDSSCPLAWAQLLPQVPPAQRAQRLCQAGACGRLPGSSICRCGHACKPICAVASCCR